MATRKRAQRGWCKCLWRRRCLSKKEGKVKNRKENTLQGEFARQTSGGWKGVLEMVQEWFYKKGNRTDPRRLRTSFKNKFCQAHHRYDKTPKTPICRFCGDSPETVWHIVSGWRKFAQRENRNGEVEITWDMTIFADKRPKETRPDIIVVHKGTQEWTLIYIAVLKDQNIFVTEEKNV